MNEKGRHAFICNVPHTINVAINFVINNDLDADLYLTTVFEGAEEVGKRIREKNVFKNVYILDSVLLTYPITVKKCLAVVKNGKKLIRDLKGRKYDYCYYNNSGWLINSLFYTGFYKGNHKVTNRFLEHGAYSYTVDYADKPWYLRPLINLIGCKCMDGSMLEALYVFRPEWVSARTDGELRKMETIDPSNVRIVDVLNHAYNYSQDQFSDFDTVILEQGPVQVDYDIEGEWRKIVSALNNRNIIVKAHPRQKNSILQSLGFAISKNHSIPWEIDVMNTNNISEKTLITVGSTAAYTPKYYFDKEPRVIFLFKLLPVKDMVVYKNLEAFLSNLREEYSDPEKLFIPNTWEEFVKYCEKYNL